MKQSFSMSARSALLGAAFAGLAASAASAQPFQAGVLACNVAPGFGVILGSSKDISCVFHRARGRVEYYAGRIDRVGVDLGVTGPEQLSWAVVAPRPRLPRHALAGSYTGSYNGVGAEVAVVGGAEGDSLVGETNAGSLWCQSLAPPQA
jgi:hypothetical protein